MTRILRNISAALLCICLSAPVVVSAQGRHTNGGRTERTSGNRGHSSGSSRGSSNSDRNSAYSRGNNSNGHRPSVGTGSNNRPDNNGYRPGNNSRPGNNGNGHRPSVGTGSSNRPDNNGYRPGNNGNGHRPSVGTGSSNRPDNNGYRPGSNSRPNNNGNGHRPSVGTGSNSRPDNNGYRPGNHRPGNNGFSHNFGPGHRPTHVAPPYRPYRPAMHRPHYRPLPPRGWRPVGRIPVIRGILGLTFGTALNLSLDYLLTSGYSVDGYTNDVVYLRNVNAMNYIWTDAALYYGSNGLDASSFYYSTPGYDLARYNNVYNALVATYGMPVSVNNTVGSVGATWFGGNNGYITLSFGSNNINGGLRYLTTLTFGL